MLIANNRSGTERRQLELAANLEGGLGELRVGQVAKNRQAAQLQVEHAFDINAFAFLLIGGLLVDLHEDIAEHFQDIAIAVGDDGGGAWDAVEASHLAE